MPSRTLLRQFLDSSRKYVEIDALPRAKVLNKFLTGELMSPEMLQITTGLFFLDVPYLILRIVLMVEHGFYTSSGLFFAMKNTLMLLLQVSINNWTKILFYRATACSSYKSPCRNSDTRDDFSAQSL
jgi:hypothetical protein